jgi:diguanylate cyclase (GGDEF)-like protein
MAPRWVRLNATKLGPSYPGADTEIAIIVPTADSPGAIEAEKVRRAIEVLQLPNATNVSGEGWLTASIGVAAAVARDGGSMRMPESLLLAADTALSKAKREGRNRIRIGTALLVARHGV